MPFWADIEPREGFLDLVGVRGDVGAGCQDALRHLGHGALQDRLLDDAERARVGKQAVS